MRIRQKLIIITIGLSIIPLLFIMALSYKNARDNLEKEICAKLEVSRKLKADKIETFFRYCMNDLVVQQNRNEIKSSIPIMERHRQNPSDPSYKKTKKNLDNQFRLLMSAKQYINVMLLNAQGLVIYESEPQFEVARLDKPLPGTDPDLFEKSQKENRIGGIYSTGFPDHPLGKLLVGAVTDSSNRFIGAIALSVDMQYLYGFVEDRTGLGETGETLIVQKKGDDRVLFISPLRHDPQALLTKENKIGSSDATAAQNAVTGRNGIGRGIDYSGVPVFASWQYLPSLNWGLIVKIDIEEALVPVYHLRKLILLLTLITAILVILVSMGTAKIIADPIRKLHRGSEIIGRGNLDYKVGGTARDEIGQLSRAFDDMVANIKKLTSSRDELEGANQKLKSEMAVRKRAEEALRETNAYLDNLFNYANAPIIVWDPQFCITRFNHAFEALTGFSAAEVVGRPLNILFPPARVSSSIELIRKTQTGERWEAIEIGILQRTGGIRTVLWNSATLFGPDGKKPEATIAQGQDITERKLAEQELGEIVKELAHSNAELEQFAFVASHDLKSPLRAIESLASWIEEDLAGALTDSSRQHINLLRQRVRRMERLLNDLLDYSRIGRVSHEVHEVDTAELICQTLNLLNIPEGFRTEIRSPMPILQTQVAPLRQVFQNLIGNAIKHHDRKEGLVTVTSKDQGEFVEFRVLDDGPGIPREFHNRVFGMFQTLKPRDEVEGSGIGLAVVKKIIEHFGGTIAIEPGDPRGITFQFTWPKTM
jgi:PAS domain S-box-containing protein